MPAGTASWLRRYPQRRPVGLTDHSHAPHPQPRKISAEVKQQVVALRQQLPTFGTRRGLTDCATSRGVTPSGNSRAVPSGRVVRTLGIQT